MGTRFSKSDIPEPIREMMDDVINNSLQIFYTKEFVRSCIEIHGDILDKMQCNIHGAKVKLHYTFDENESMANLQFAIATCCEAAKEQAEFVVEYLLQGIKSLAALFGMVLTIEGENASAHLKELFLSTEKKPLHSALMDLVKDFVKRTDFNMDLSKDELGEAISKCCFVISNEMDDFIRREEHHFNGEANGCVH